MDIETGLYYCNARYYDPKIYQWIQPVNSLSLNLSNIDGLKIYAYAVNSPIETIYNLTAFNVPNIKYKLSWPDLSFISNFFSFFGDTVSFITDIISMNRKNKGLPEIKQFKKITRALTFLSMGIDAGISFYENFIVNESKTFTEKCGNFAGDLIYIELSTGVSYLVSKAIGKIPYVGPFLAVPVSILVGKILDQIWEKEDILWIDGLKVSIDGKSLEEWLKEQLTEFFKKIENILK